MLMVGDKIRKVKDVPGVSQIGDDITVSGVENGVISFETTLGAGVMSYGEYEKYFEKCESTPQKSVEKREWNNKEYSYKYDCVYRTNGKSVQAYCGNVSSRASCLDSDKFDLDFGIKLACTRAKIKYWKRLAKEKSIEINKMISDRYSGVI